jgi:aminoglycoside 6'-N-acetyltransferase I
MCDPNHLLAVCIDDGVIVGMVSAVRYYHPDKLPQLWINEVGVAPTYRRRGIATSLVGLILAKAKELGCHGAWVLTDDKNEAAMSLYSSLLAKAQSQVLFSFTL